MTPDRFNALKQAMVADLVAEPDDLSTHCAYADLLAEHGDASEAARAEFIRVQLALEDESRPTRERNRLRKREQELLAAHHREWLGELAPFLLDGEVPGYEAAHQGFQQFPVFRIDRPPWLPDGEPWEPTAGDTGAVFRFRRGWLNQLHLPCLSNYLGRVFRRSQTLVLLHQLIIDEVADYDNPPPEPSDNVPEREHSIGLCPLVGATSLANIRHFRLGPEPEDDYRAYRCWIHTTVLPAILRQMPKVEELHLFANGYNLNEVFRSPTMANVRVLQIYHRGQVHRLQLLVKNPAARNLSHLLIHPHNANAWGWNMRIDERSGYRSQDGYLPLSVVRPLLHSPNLPKLQHLRLRCSSMGDEGCREIVRSGILTRLKTLDLRHGRITDRGARILASSWAVRGLEALDLDRNALTEPGIREIRRVVPHVRADDQQTPAEMNSDYPPYLTEGEFE